MREETPRVPVPVGRDIPIPVWSYNLPGRLGPVRGPLAKPPGCIGAGSLPCPSWHGDQPPRPLGVRHRHTYMYVVCACVRVRLCVRGGGEGWASGLWNTVPGGTEYKIMIYYSGGGHDLGTPRYS